MQLSGIQQRNTLQVDLRKSKLLWLEAERLKAVARRSAEVVNKNAEDHDQKAKEAARQKGPHRCAHPFLGLDVSCFKYKPFMQNGRGSRRARRARTGALAPANTRCAPLSLGGCCSSAHGAALLSLHAQAGLRLLCASLFVEPHAGCRGQQARVCMGGTYSGLP